MLEAEVCGWGPSGRNGGFLNGYWTHLSRLRPVFGDGGALAIAHAAPARCPAVRAFCAARGEDVWLREGGYLKVSAAPAQDAAVERSIRTAAELGVAEEARSALGGGGRGAVPLPRLPPRRPLPRRRDRAAGAPRPGAQARRARRRDRPARAHPRDRPALGPAGGARDAARHGAGRRGGRRDERGARRLAPALATAHELRELRRPDRAGARPPGGDRLDGRRGDHGRAHVRPLLPDDPGRPRPHGQRLGADRARRTARRAASRTTTGRPRAPRPACGGCFRRSRARASSERGAARSTSRSTTSRSSARCPATRIHHGAGYSGHGVGPELARRPDPRLARARPPTTSGAPRRSSGRPARRFRPSRSSASAAARSAPRPSRSRRRRSEGRRGAGRSPAPSRALPRLLRMPLGTR